MRPAHPFRTPCIARGSWAADASLSLCRREQAADPKLAPILGELNKQSTKLEKDRALEERVRREARNIAREGAAGDRGEAMDLSGPSEGGHR